MVGEVLIHASHGSLKRLNDRDLKPEMKTRKVTFRVVEVNNFGFRVLLFDRRCAPLQVGVTHRPVKVDCRLGHPFEAVEV